jgi:hypothetical protein
MATFLAEKMIAYDAKTGRWFFKPEIERVREAFRLFLSGEASYKDVGQRVGIAPFNLRNILRNPTHTGWRIYSQRRDPSSAAIRTCVDGRQGDRPKIARAPEDVIRVKVLEPIISETEFAQVQRILDLKKQRHWRARPDHERRFTFSGFLRCGSCGNLVYTHSGHGRAWYVCKSRTAEVRKERRARGLEECSNPYMRREPLERCLDTLIADRLTNSDFLRQLASAHASRKSPNEARGELSRIERLFLQVKEKRQRVLDAYFENLINRTQRDSRLEALSVDAELYGNLATRATSIAPQLTARELADLFGVFHEWEFLGRADKRKLLRATMPEIVVQNYRVVGLSLIPRFSSGDEINRMGRDSSPRPA